MKRSVIGLLAHVDAGKTTLAEAMLYCAGSIRTLGRVDHGDTFLDTFAMEKQRGITIFSKQALITLGDLCATLLDTPGHVDFSAEMERTLDILDCAVLVIGGRSGVQSHTRTLWKLLRKRNIPTFLFVSKMDLPDADKANILAELQNTLDDRIMDLSCTGNDVLALCDEALLDELLETDTLSEDAIRAAIARGTLFPVWFGAALKLDGVEEFMNGLACFAPAAFASDAFSARVYKIARDSRNVRETHLKVTGGVLHVRQTIAEVGEKITALRIYSGTKYRTVEKAFPGELVAAIGLSKTHSGMSLGSVDSKKETPVLTPVLTYRVVLPEDWDTYRALPLFRQLEEEDPQLHVEVQSDELRVQIMGPVQLETLQYLLETRFALKVSFCQSSILYRESIADTVEGVGHYEPLQHYAEVHLLLEPGERGSGLVFQTTCSEDVLEKNWQRLILTHLEEKQHLGVLTGAPITDMQITLVAGKANIHYTEGGDFREATYRAVRQGLMQAKSVLLEPWYNFCLKLPKTNAGRAITDLQRMGAELLPVEYQGDTAIVSGDAPVAALWDYPQEIRAYTHGAGHIAYTPKGYAPCSNSEKIVKQIGYQPVADLDNTPDSIFCAHGAGYHVPWNEVFCHMHIPAIHKPPAEPRSLEELGQRYQEMAATDKELLQIFERTYGPIKRSPASVLHTEKGKAAEKVFHASPLPSGPEYLLVDGYNMIFSWDDLRQIAKIHLHSARDRLIDIMRNYQSFRQNPVILVFDAYKVKGNPGSVEQYGGLSVVYTKEAQTADMYIERLSYNLGKNHQIRVATSDGAEQMIILGHGALRVPAQAFRSEVDAVMETIRSYLSEV